MTALTLKRRVRVTVKPLSRFDQYAINMRVVGFQGTRAELNELGCFIRTAIRHHVKPVTPEQILAWAITMDVWGDLIFPDYGKPYSVEIEES